MSARNAGHQANLEYWREQISNCRSSGKPVRDWCKEQGIERRKYYYWEHICRKELSNNTTAQADDHSPLVRIAPAQLPESYHATAPSDHPGIVIRIGEAEIVLPPEIGMSSVAELVKQLRPSCSTTRVSVATTSSAAIRICESRSTGS